MSNDRFASAHEMVREYQELEAKMADPSIHEDQGMKDEARDPPRI